MRASCEPCGDFAGQSMFGHKRPEKDPCKHVAATVYKLTEAIDADATQLFLLRGANPLVSPHVAVPGYGTASKKRTRPPMHDSARTKPPSDVIVLGGEGDSVR